MGNNGDANFLSTNLNHDVCKNNCHKVVEILNIWWESYIYIINIYIWDILDFYYQ